MTPAALYSFRIGASVEIALFVDGPAADAVCRAALKRLPEGGGRPPAGSPEAAVFSPSWVIGLVGTRNGFLLALAPEVSATLEPGTYEMDARVRLVGGAERIATIIHVAFDVPVTGPLP